MEYEEQEGVREIGSGLELFIDRWLIEKLEDAELRLHRPVPREVVMVWDKPWEGNSSSNPVVIQEKDRYRLYYRGSAYKEEGYRSLHAFTCYTESRDGIQWERPELGMIAFEGSKDNNIVASAREGSTNIPIPFLDENPQAPASERYKAVVGDMDYGFYGYVSADGIKWERAQAEPFFPDDRGYDWERTAFWDPLEKRYYAYLRGWRKTGGGEAMNLKLIPAGKRWRDVRYCTSDDFRRWTETTMTRIDPPLSPEEQIYDSNIKPYPRAPHILIGTAKRYMPGRKKLMNQPHGGLSDGVLLVGRDRCTFRRWGEAFIRPGTEPKAWMTRNNMPSKGMLQTSPEEISIYWVDRYHIESDPARLRRGTIRTDGFVSVHAGYGGGEMLTRPLTFIGGKLVINYATSAYGSIQVEMQSAEGRAIEGFRMDQCPLIYGDDIAHRVEWEDGSDVRRLAGEKVRIRFRITDGDLYSLRFID